MKKRRVGLSKNSRQAELKGEGEVRGETEMPCCGTARKNKWGGGRSQKDPVKGTAGEGVWGGRKKSGKKKKSPKKKGGEGKRGVSKRDGKRKNSCKEDHWGMGLEKRS